MESNLIFNFASRKEGQAILSKNDEYLQKMNPFERALKMKTNLKISKDEYISFLKKNVLDWDCDEIDRLNKALNILKDRLLKFEINFDGNIPLIKTSGKEEWNSAYTRGCAIILPVKKNRGI